MTTTPTTAEPLFHLRAYGDVTEAELTKYATPAEIAQAATPEPPQASAPSVQVVEPSDGDYYSEEADDIEWSKARRAAAQQPADEPITPADVMAAYRLGVRDAIAQPAVEKDEHDSDR
jgi:hypothetical protein